MFEHGPARWLCHAATLAVAIVGVSCLLLSRGALSATYDEPQHLSAGLEWWQRGTYRSWTENPPLPRVALAAIPYLSGMRLPEQAPPSPPQRRWFSTWMVGINLLLGGDGYETNLARARTGTLPFFLILLGAVWVLAEGRRRPVAGLVAVGLTATLPLLVSNGALATTDVPFTAMALLAIVGWVAWLREARPGRAALLGAALGGALLAKFTALVFVPIALVSLLAARRLTDGRWRPAGRRIAAQGALAAVTAFVVVWAGYRFSVGRIGDIPEPALGWLQVVPAERGPLARFFLEARLPAPELFHGLLFAKRHNDLGQTAYLFGQLSPTGFRSFYPLALLVKTPLPFLALLAAAPALAFRRARQPGTWPWVGAALAALSILVASVGSRVNIGLRHVMPVLPLLAVAIAGAWTCAFGAGRRRVLLAAAAGIALVWQAGVTIAAHPNQLSYFNVLAGHEPAEVLLSSDLDWGQGLLQLRDEARARAIPSLKVATFGADDICRLGLPPLEPLPPGQPTTGWIAISENHYRHRSYFALLSDPCDRHSIWPRSAIPPRPYQWLRAYRPVAIVAGSIRLYYIP
jgi:4-amino-4-deoxy-L-arabinose transferase-like glycosyltransferase